MLQGAKGVSAAPCFQLVVLIFFAVTAEVAGREVEGAGSPPAPLDADTAEISSFSVQRNARSRHLLSSYKFHSENNQFGAVAESDRDVH